MLYRFKSPSSADVLMLESHARQLLDIVGKPPGERGIITAGQIPAAIAALQAAVQREAELGPRNHDAHAAEEHDDYAEAQHVGLHQRAAPLLKMLRESQAADKDVVWGV